MLVRIVAFLCIFCFACSSAKQTAKKELVANQNKDVIVLSYLIRDYMRKTHRTNFALSDILTTDSLTRITKNFEYIELRDWPNPIRGGYIVYYKFSKERNQDAIVLKESEKVPSVLRTKNVIGRNEKELHKKFDGELHFNYPERFYWLRGIVVKSAE